MRAETKNRRSMPAKWSMIMDNIRIDLKKNKMVYLMALPVILYYLVFQYGPMGGLLIAFKEYRPGRGILGSAWADFYGLGNFIDFFTSYDCGRLIWNTIRISVVSIVVGFPLPIILALTLNEVKSERFKKTVQTITYLPHFISVVVISGIIVDLVGTEGLITAILQKFGYTGGNLLNVKEYFTAIFVGSNIWQNIGFQAIIYIAALASVPSDVYEAARIDGANRWKQMLHVSLPGIAPTITIMLIMRMGNIMSVGWEKIILLYNPGIYETADVISTYVYRLGIEGSRVSYTAAIGMFNSLINFGMLLIANKIGKKINGSGLW